MSGKDSFIGTDVEIVVFDKDGKVKLVIESLVTSKKDKQE
jgi:predicted transcriptional regulator